MIVNTFGTPDLMAKSRPKKKGRKSEAPKKSAQQDAIEEDSSDEWLTLSWKTWGSYSHS